MEEYTIEEFDKYKTKVLKYILYKKRTEQEIKTKFSKEIDEILLEDIIEHLKENGYIDDEEYIKRALNEYININSYSIKEIQNKLHLKGLKTCLIEKYIDEYEEKLKEYELKNAIKIVNKKKEKTIEEIQAFLYRKGYLSESIRKAIEEVNFIDG